MRGGHHEQKGDHHERRDSHHECREVVMSLFGAISVSASGMEAQRIRAELLTENMANADTTRTPEGGPDRRKDAVFMSTPIENTFAGTLAEVSAGGPQGVRVSSVSVDQTDPDRRYQP